MTTTTFDALGLSAPVRRVLAERGFSKPTPIQAKAIPPVLDGADLVGLAETGSGKTLAFVLPILDDLALEKSEEGFSVGARECAALILAPTRELAVQIHDDVVAFGKPLGLSSAVILGGVPRGRQERALSRGVDIVVGTPGRILDLASTDHLRFGVCEDFVLDEADRMLDLGFVHDVRRIARSLPKDRRTLMFSATWPDNVAKLAADLLNDPVRIEAGERKAKPTPDRIAQSIIFVARGADDPEPLPSRADALRDVFADDAVSKAIVFTRTKRGANRVAELLEKAGVGADAIHGNKSQNARQRALDNFKSGKIRALVATDIAARGIDVPDVTHVVNFDMPTTAETYVHRIGRTARAGKSGGSVSLCCAEEMGELRDIERLIGKSIDKVGTAPRPVKPTAKNSGRGPKPQRPPRSNNSRGGQARSGERAKSGGGAKRSGGGGRGRSHRVA